MMIHTIIVYQKVTGKVVFDYVSKNRFSSIDTICIGGFFGALDSISEVLKEKGVNLSFSKIISEGECIYKESFFYLFDFDLLILYSNTPISVIESVAESLTEEFIEIITKDIDFNKIETKTFDILSERFRRILREHAERIEPFKQRPFPNFFALCNYPPNSF